MGGIKSELIDFELTRDTCFICGKLATTVEHVIPKWLQRKFNLWDYKLIIPNQTDITYRQLVVPACKKCNNEVYGRLEVKIRNNTANDKEIWRWANKIHFGLQLKDRFLDFDRSKPGIKISEVFNYSDALQQSRHFLHCVNNDFTCQPDPFGSVFKFQFEEEQSFNLIHLNHSNSLFICIGKVAFIVFITDGQILRQDDVGICKKYEQLYARKHSMADALFFFAQMVYYMEQYTYSNPIAFHSKSIVKLGRATLRAEKPVDKDLFRRICDRFGITWIDEEELRKKISGL